MSDSDDLTALRAQLSEVAAALGPRLAKDETPAQAVTRLVESGVILTKVNDEHFASARRNAEENERLSAELTNSRRALAAVCTAFPPDTDVRFVMSAIIGVCEHEDGPTVIQYLGQLERLLKEVRSRLPDEETTRLPEASR